MDEFMFKAFKSLRAGDGELSFTFSFRFAHFHFRFIVRSHISISFKENQFIAMNRSETFTMPDFIASCGGLLGLFMGISLMSIIELIYYFSLRMCCKWRRQRQIIQTTSKTPTTWATRNDIFWIQPKQHDVHIT